jgi:hypothetical protein
MNSSHDGKNASISFGNYVKNNNNNKTAVQYNLRIFERQILTF